MVNRGMFTKRLADIIILWSNDMKKSSFELMKNKCSNFLEKNDHGNNKKTTCIFGILSIFLMVLRYNQVFIEEGRKSKEKCLYMHRWCELEFTCAFCCSC